MYYYLKIFILCTAQENSSAVVTCLCARLDSVSPSNFVFLLECLFTLSYECTRTEGDIYGTFDERNQTWSGAVRELIENKNDVFIGAMDTNYLRWQVITYLYPLEYAT